MSKFNVQIEFDDSKGCKDCPLVKFEAHSSDIDDDGNFDFFGDIFVK